MAQQLQQYQSRLEDKDLSAVLELAAEELEDKKAKRVSPLLSVVRDEEIVLDLVFHSLCTAIDTGLEYCTEKNVKAKALKVRSVFWCTCAHARVCVCLS